jgi:hypothetical protein
MPTADHGSSSRKLAGSHPRLRPPLARRARRTAAVSTPEWCFGRLPTRIDVRTESRGMLVKVAEAPAQSQ